MSGQAFSPEERAAVYRAIAERRDMRHFSGGEVAPELLSRLLEAAHQAPSVGLMQPWRFIRITRPALREAIHGLVEEERLRTAEALGERSDEFMQLKVEGIRDCAELLVVALMEGREAHVFGRRTGTKQCGGGNRVGRQIEVNIGGGHPPLAIDRLTGALVVRAFATDQRLQCAA